MPPMSISILESTKLLVPSTFCPLVLSPNFHIYWFRLIHYWLPLICTLLDICPYYRKWVQVNRAGTKRVPDLFVPFHMTLIEYMCLM